MARMGDMSNLSNKFSNKFKIPLLSLVIKRKARTKTQDLKEQYFFDLTGDLKHDRIQY